MARQFEPNIFKGAKDPVWWVSGTTKKNKSSSSAPQIQPYSGYRPPHVNYDAKEINGYQEGNIPTGNSFRPVEKQITDILARRSIGQDVGYDPARLQKMKQNYDIDANEVNKQREADIVNQLSGTGQSRNLGARDILLDRYKRQAELDRQKNFNNYDIADMAEANSEKRENTQGLQRLNEFNFGQENNVADFDLRAYLAEQGVAQAANNTDLANRRFAYDTQQDPMGDLLSTAGTVAGLYASTQNPYAAILTQMANQRQQPGTFGTTGASVSPSVFQDYNYTTGTSPYSKSLKARAYQLGGM